MNHTAEHLSRVANFETLFKSHSSFGERIISFERAETKHAKVASRENKQPMRRQFKFHIICINFQVVFFWRIRDWLKSTGGGGEVGRRISKCGG